MPTKEHQIIINPPRLTRPYFRSHFKSANTQLGCNIRKSLKNLTGIIQFFNIIHMVLYNTPTMAVSY